MKKIKIEFSVGDNPGFDLNTSALTFGKIPLGSSSTRSIVFENNFDFPISAEIYPSKNVRNLLSYTHKINIYHEPVRESLILSIPKSYEYGNYSGEITIYFRKVKG